MDAIKNQLAESALSFIKENSIVGLGTGTTAEVFIENLAGKCKKGFSIKAVASSSASYSLAKKLDIEMIDLDKIDLIDFYVDGADEVDFKKNMIKGKGGALLREKILANSSSKVIIMIDHTKYVKKLGKALLPVEITPFGSNLTKNNLKRLGYFSDYRMNKNSNLFVTENNNYILDIKLSYQLEDPIKHHILISSVPGVVDTGLFIDIADVILVGYPQGKVEIIS
jgi:ribose 5-phosphate isomerase A